MNKTLFPICIITLATVLSSQGEPNKAVIDKFSSVTNFVRASQSVRNDLRNSINTAIKESDIETLSALLSILAKDGNGKVENPTYDIWNAAADAMVNSALEQRKKKPEEQKELLAGFREGGTTFGLWQGSDEIQKVDAYLTKVGENILLKEMPKKDLSLYLQYRLLNSILNIRKRASTDSEQIAAHKELIEFALSHSPTEKDDMNAVFQAMMTSLNFYLERDNNKEMAELAQEFLGKQSALLKACGEEGKIVAYEATGFYRDNDENGYNSSIKKFLARPMKAESIKDFEAFQFAMTKGRHFNTPPFSEVEKIAASFIEKRATLTAGQERLNTLLFAVSVCRGSQNLEGAVKYFWELKDYTDNLQKAWDDENAREKVAREAEVKARVNKEPFTRYERNTLIIRPNNLIWRALSQILSPLVNEGYNEEYIKIAKELFNPKTNPNDYWNYLLCTLRTGNKEDALKICDYIEGTNTTSSLDQKFNAKMARSFINARNAKDFISKLNGLRSDFDSIQKEGLSQADLEKNFFNKLRFFSRVLLSINSNESGYQYLKALENMTRNMLHPEEKVSYTASFLEDAPTSADSAYISQIFTRLPTENRFGRYNAYDWFNKDAELKRLKSLEAPKLNANTEGKEGEVAIAYDINGLHVYIKVNDPNAWKARDGLAGGVTFEYSIMPGEDKPWHWNMITSGAKMQDFGVVWDSPRKGFKVAMEYVREDSVIKDDCHVFHIYFPWVLFPYELPQNGDIWRFALIGGWAGQFGALGGGAVHEMGRSLAVKFDIGKDVRSLLKRNLLRQSVAEYKKVRTPFENAEFWCDPHLGDVEFFDVVVSPYLKQLDGIAKEISDGEPDNSKVDQYLKDYLFDLVDFRLSLDAKRADYLKKKFFK